MKKLINKKNTAYQSFIQNGKSAESFQFFRTFKVCYYQQLKLPNNNVTRRFLKNWSILVQAQRLIIHFWKLFWTRRNYFAFLHYFVINWFQSLGSKLNYLTVFLAKHCTLIDNPSEIPVTLNIKTIKILSSFPVTRANIAKIIKNLDLNKAHRRNMIIIWKLKLCGDLVLPTFFKSCCESENKCSFSVQKRW